MPETLPQDLRLPPPFIVLRTRAALLCATILGEPPKIPVSLTVEVIFAIALGVGSAAEGSSLGDLCGWSVPSPRR